MNAWCGNQLDWIFWLAVAFLTAAVLLGTVSALKALMAKPQEPDNPDKVASLALDGQPIGPILEALKGLIEALGKAPAWFALFLAGLFLFWLAGEIYVDACKPTAQQQQAASPNAQAAGGQRTPAANSGASANSAQAMKAGE